MNIRKRRSNRSGRAPLSSPGRPPVAGRDERRRFWAAIAAGKASEVAAVGAGVPPAVGTRWFRKAGGMPPAMFGLSAKPLSGRYLSFMEREEIGLLRAQGHTIQEVARRIGRAASTISRELRRNAATRSGGLEYRATTAQWHAERAARRPKQAKLALNAALQAYVEERLAGAVVAPSGAPVPGPAVSWNGRRHGPRQDRRWASAWSPEQIARRLPIDFPEDETMRISHEAIYQALFVQGRGALRRELTACLRTGRALRMPQARTRGRGKTFISPEIMISQRPVEAADRAVPGHWEGDLILGLGSSAIGTLVERTTRFTLLLHLPRMRGHGHEARVKNGPALAGHGAEAVRDAITRTIITLPEQLRRSLTWDQGAELAQHARLKIDAGVQVYFCDPHSPWQRGTNENTNGLLRQYFPKGTDLSIHSAEEVAAVAAALNSRPRRTLDWKTPAEVLDQLLLSVNKDRVATTA
jgi:IS30 family transposase